MIFWLWSPLIGLQIHFTRWPSRNDLVMVFLRSGEKWELIHFLPHAAGQQWFKRETGEVVLRCFQEHLVLHTDHEMGPILGDQT